MKSFWKGIVMAVSKRELKNLGLLLSAFILSACSQGIGNKEIQQFGNLGISLIASSGSEQFVDPGQKFENPVVVKVVDPVGNPINGVPISFVTDGTENVSILSPTGVTDKTGTFATNVVAPNVLNKKFQVFAQVSNGQIKVPFNLATFPEQLLVISDGPTYNFESEAVGSTRFYGFVLDNTGTTPATHIFGQIDNLPFHFRGGFFPGTGGTCTTVLAGGDSCIIMVSFSPTAVGFNRGTLEVNYRDGDINRVATRSLQGTGANLGKLEISEDPEYDFGPIAVGGTIDHTFVVENTGTLNVSAISSDNFGAHYKYKDGTYPGTGGTCGVLLTPGNTCTLVVSFNPIAAGLHIDTIRLSYYNGVSSDNAERSVRGTGSTPAMLDISDGPIYDFGTQAVNSLSEHAFTVTNNGNSPATSLGGGTILAPFGFKGGVYPGTGGTCTATLNNGANCTIVINYAPQTAALHTGTVVITYNDGAGPASATRDVQGTGANLGYLEISNNPLYDFSVQPVGSTTDFTFTVTNTGTGSVSGAAGTGLIAPFSFKGGAYPGTGGNCGATFTPGQSCSLVVSFAPTVAGNFYDTIQIDYNDSSSARYALRDISGTGVSAAFLEISNSPFYDYGNQALNTSTDFIFTVSNTGGVAATSMSGAGLAAPFSFKGGAYPGTGGSCSASLAPSSTCTFVVTFNPTTTGIFSDTVEIDYNDGATTKQATRDVQGSGTNQAVITISEGPLFDYGIKSLGSVTDHIFVLENTGGLNATGVAGTGLAAPFTFKDGSYPGTGGTCGATLAAAANCTLVVTYSPTSTGLQTDTIEINYNDGSSGQTSTRIIQGTGATVANLLISDGPVFDFGTKAVGTQTDQVFNVSNTGGVAATTLAGLPLLSPFNYKGGSYPGTGGTCGATINSGANCTLIITYAPNTMGVHSDTIQVSYNDGSTTQIATRDITGTGATVALLTISDGPTYDYGTQAIGSNTDHTFTVNNSGGLTATSLTDLGIALPFSFKGGSYPGTGGTCGANLPSLATCTMVVTYSPIAPGAHTDDIEISYNDGLNPQTATRNLQGSAANSAFLAISDGPTYNYGTKALTSVSDHTFNVTNTGSITATSIAGASLTAPFSFKGGAYPGTGGTCGATLAAAGSCSVVVSFSPTVSGLQTDTLQLDYNDGTGTANSQVGLQGTGASAALLAISDGPTYDFGTHAVGSNIDHSFTINNVGGVTATTISGAVLTPPFDYKGGVYPGTGGNCGATLGPAASCSIVVTYSPTMAGVHSGTIPFDYNNGVA